MVIGNVRHGEDILALKFRRLDPLVNTAAASDTDLSCNHRVNDATAARLGISYVVNLKHPTRAVEKVLVTEEENEVGIDSELVDLLSAYIINERNPVCYGADLRWANHIYPIYLTESFVKSKYLSTESFLHLF